jgi:hypothetical protein
MLELLLAGRQQWRYHEQQQGIGLSEMIADTGTKDTLLSYEPTADPLQWSDRRMQ